MTLVDTRDDSRELGLRDAREAIAEMGPDAISQDELNILREAGALRDDFKEARSAEQANILLGQERLYVAKEVARAARANDIQIDTDTRLQFSHNVDMEALSLSNIEREKSIALNAGSPIEMVVNGRKAIVGPAPGNFQQTAEEVRQAGKFAIYDRAPAHS